MASSSSFCLQYGFYIYINILSKWIDLWFCKKTPPILILHWHQTGCSSPLQTQYRFCFKAADICECLNWLFRDALKMMLWVTVWQSADQPQRKFLSDFNKLFGFGNPSHLFAIYYHPLQYTLPCCCPSMNSYRHMFEFCHVLFFLLSLSYLVQYRWFLPFISVEIYFLCVCLLCSQIVLLILCVTYCPKEVTTHGTLHTVNCSLLVKE